MIPRCSFFFENPNMAAVLFVQLALFGRCGLARRPRIGAALTFLASLAVVLTGSRGGFVALVAGLVLAELVKGGGLAKAGRAKGAWLCGWWRRARARRRGVLAASATIVAALVLVATLAFGGLGSRLCAIPHDGSVANRLLLWKSVPAMMADAPGGWGLGRSGEAFVDWYQPLDRHEMYRTMVGSHQTLLVELGTAGRVLYLVGWLLALTLSFRFARATGRAHAAAQWTALAIAAAFSSVLETGLLWIIPALALVPVLRNLPAARPSARLWTGLAVGALAPILLIQFCCGSSERRFEDRGRVSRWIGSQGPESRWLLPDARVLGAHWPRRLRAAQQALSVADSPDGVPAEATELIVCAAARRVGRGRFPALRKVTYLSPHFRPLVCDPTFERIVLGEFAPDAPVQDAEGVVVLPGLSDFLESGREEIGF